MAGKIIVIVLVALCLSLSSCYPELSVQQYDKLKEDLAELDEQHTELETELELVKTELKEIKTRNQEIRAYIDFMVQLVSTQSSESLLKGEFDTGALIEAKEQLLTAAEILEDVDISYYLSLIDPENEDETVGVYYKVIEYCLKNIKQKLTLSPKS